MIYRNLDQPRPTSTETSLVYFDLIHFLHYITATLSNIKKAIETLETNTVILNLQCNANSVIAIEQVMISIKIIFKN